MYLSIHQPSFHRNHLEPWVTVGIGRRKEWHIEVGKEFREITRKVHVEKETDHIITTSTHNIHQQRKIHISLEPHTN